MAERPGPLGQLDRLFGGATIAHEYISDLHQELVGLHEDSERTRELLGESAAVILEQMPRLTSDLRRLEREWDEQALLDSSQAARTLSLIAVGLAEVEPELAALRVRQNEIAAELRDRIVRALGR